MQNIIEIVLFLLFYYFFNRLRICSQQISLVVEQLRSFNEYYQAMLNEKKDAKLLKILRKHWKQLVLKTTKKFHLVHFVQN